jgi:hypothetical protein
MKRHHAFVMADFKQIHAWQAEIGFFRWDFIEIEPMPGQVQGCSAVLVM